LLFYCKSTDRKVLWIGKLVVKFLAISDGKGFIIEFFEWI